MHQLQHHAYTFVYCMPRTNNLSLIYIISFCITLLTSKIFRYKNILTILRFLQGDIFQVLLLFVVVVLITSQSAKIFEYSLVFIQRLKARRILWVISGLTLSAHAWKMHILSYTTAVSC